ncbi:MAG: SOS response-associated peptidase [Defluviitaleaceae bacterium]|nr:SOS response-associated peptidase [Defluviitaleaceae bacterium]
MCGRYVIKDDGDIIEIEKILSDIRDKYSGMGVPVKTGDISPADNAPVLSLQGGRPFLSLMKWGFAKWDGKGVIINAKAETASEKMMFSKSLFQRRCVIPSTGFYEWDRQDVKSKPKHRFNVIDSPMLYMAGIYSEHSGGAQKEPITNRFVILTRAANEFVVDIHDRMPVILHKSELVQWLTDYDFAASVMRRDNITLTHEVV